MVGVGAVFVVVERAVVGVVAAGGGAADHFHDVDLAAAGPANGADVFAEHPEGRPDALALGQAQARGELAVGPGVEALGFKPAEV